MNQPHSASTQRDLLEQSERDAKRKQPENYQQEAAANKIVSTEQASPHDVGSIHGLDNTPDEQRHKPQPPTRTGG